MDNLIYRKASPSDIDKLSKLRIEFIKLNNNISDSTNDEILHTEIVKFLEEKLGGNEIDIFLAECSGNIIATSMISYYTLPPKFSNLSGKNAYITNIYVLPEFRNRGIAKKIMEIIIDDSHKKGCEVITLHTTEMGKKLYRELNFKDKNTEMILQI